MVNEWMYGAASQSGWWMGPYSTGGDSHEGILRNTGALKNGISMLGEARGSGGATRPAEGGTNSPRQRASQGLRAPVGELGGAALHERPPAADPGARSRTRSRTRPATSSAGARCCAGPTCGRWSRGWARTRTTSPTSTRRLPSRILDPAPCGYFIPQSEYTMARTATSARSRQRLADHGIKVEPQAGGVLVPLQQPYARPGRADPRLRRGAADDHHRAAALLVPEDRPAGRRHGPGDAVARARRAGRVRAVHARRGEGLHGDARRPRSSRPRVTRR